MPEEIIDSRYTPEAMNALKGWFKDHDSELPQSLQLNASEYLPDLRLTIDCLFQRVAANWENPTFHTNIRRLYDIQAKIIEMNKAAG